jgi:hypothetical protein
VVQFEAIINIEVENYGLVMQTSLTLSSLRTVCLTV